MSTAVDYGKLSVGIVSIGDMGLGVAKLLIAHGHQVYTVATGRRSFFESSVKTVANSCSSQNTIDRIKAARITNLSSDEELVAECDIIFSIVPPRDAVSTAKRIQDACGTARALRSERKGFANLVYFDLNAISSRTTKRIAALFEEADQTSVPLTKKISRTLSSLGNSGPDVSDSRPITVRYLDGGIIGGPPVQQADKSWQRPSIVISGPRTDMLSPALLSTLNMKIISDEIGSASTLKSCFAAFGKGLYALAIMSFTTAQTAGILSELQDHLQEFFPSIHAFVDKGLPSVPPKAYRWVDEMKQIGETFTEQGHFSPSHEAQAVFEGVSEIYKVMSDDTVLGKEVIGKRKRGTTTRDVADAMREGLQNKRKKAPDGKLDQTWRGSWA